MADPQPLIDVPVEVLSRMVLKIWREHGESGDTLHLGGRERFIAAMRQHTSLNPDWPSALRKPTDQELGEVFDRAVKSGAH